MRLLKAAAGAAAGAARAAAPSAAPSPPRTTCRAPLWRHTAEAAVQSVQAWAGHREGPAGPGGGTALSGEYWASLGPPHGLLRFRNARPEAPCECGVGFRPPVFGVDSMTPGRAAEYSDGAISTKTMQIAARVRFTYGTSTADDGTSTGNHETQHEEIRRHVPNCKICRPTCPPKRVCPNIHTWIFGIH